MFDQGLPISILSTLSYFNKRLITTNFTIDEMHYDFIFKISIHFQIMKVSFFVKLEL